jgi:hypothetical protein
MTVPQARDPLQTRIDVRKRQGIALTQPTDSAKLRASLSLFREYAPMSYSATVHVALSTY